MSFFDRATGISKGFGFVEMADDNTAQKAVSNINGIELFGRQVTVIEARPTRHGRRLDPYDEIIPFEISKPILQVSKQVGIDLMRHFHKYPNAIKTINQQLFEELIAEMWDGFGYKGEFLVPINDNKKFIIAVGKKIVDEKYWIECRKPIIENCVGIFLNQNPKHTNRPRKSTSLCHLQEKRIENGKKDTSLFSKY